MLKKKEKPFPKTLQEVLDGGGLFKLGDKGIARVISEAKAREEALNSSVDKELEASKESHDNLMRASASLGEVGMLTSGEDGLGIQGADGSVSEAGGSRKRRRKQDTGGGLGIG